MTPNVGDVGRFEVGTPFRNDSFFTHSLQVMRTESFGVLIEDGEEPYSQYYEPLGIEHAAYRRDVAGKEVMVSLRSTNGETRKIPSSYILTLPKTGGIEYVPVSMVIRLPSMYGATAYDAVIEALREVVQKTLGVVPVGIDVVAAGAPEFIDDLEHKIIDTERLNYSRDDSNNMLSELATLRANNREMVAKLKILEQLFIQMKLNGYYAPPSSGLMMHISNAVS